MVRICGDSDVRSGSATGDAIVFELSTTALRAALGGVTQDLQSFLRPLAEWTDTVAPRMGEILASRFDRAFAITPK